MVNHPNRQPRWKIVKTAPNRWAYAMTDGSGVGDGFRSRGQAGMAARKLLNERLETGQQTRDQDLFAGLEWLGI